MDNLDSTLGAEQMEFAAARNSVSPTSWNFLAFAIQFDKTPLSPWRRYKEFLQKPLMGGIFGFALQYFCNDMNNVTQKHGFGIITFIPYMIMFSILLALSVLWWAMYVRRVKTCLSLETLPRHRQDIQVNQTEQRMTNQTQQQLTRETRIHETSQPEDLETDQTQQGFFIRTEEFCSLMDCWFSTRLGEMTRDEALDRLRQLVERGNRRNRETSVVATAVEGQAVMIESLEMRGVERRHLSAGSSGFGTPNGLSSPVSCPCVMERSNQAEAGSLSHDGLVLRIPQNVDVGELAEFFDANLPGSRELHRRIEIGPGGGYSREFLISQMLKSLKVAWTLDKDSTIQLGSFAICKYTDAGIKCWLLRGDWTPTILHVQRSSQTFIDLFTGEKATWTVRGFNLQSATLKVATAEQAETLTDVHHYKTEHGEDVVSFKEPLSLPMFRNGVFISASNVVEVQEGVFLKLYSQARKVQPAFWISVVDGNIPRPWTVIMMASLSLLAHLFVTCNFAIALPIIIATCLYLSKDQGPRQDGDVPVGGSAALVEEFNDVTDCNSRALTEELTTMNMVERSLDRVLERIDLENEGGDLNVGGSTPPVENSTNALTSSKTTDREYKLITMDLLTEKQDGDPLPGIERLQIVGQAEVGNTVMACGLSINGTTLCMFQWVRRYRNGSTVCIEGAEKPEYTITADDYDTILSVECVPINEQNRMGELVAAVANESRWITCDTLLQDEIDRDCANEYASFEVQFQVGCKSPEENWESGNLTLMGNGYTIRHNPTMALVVCAEFSSTVSIHISVDDLMLGIITNDNYYERPVYLQFPDSRSRDACVLTFRLFQKMLGYTNSFKSEIAPSSDSSGGGGRGLLVDSLRASLAPASLETERSRPSPNSWPERTPEPSAGHTSSDNLFHSAEWLSNSDTQTHSCMGDKLLSFTDALSYSGESAGAKKDNYWTSSASSSFSSSSFASWAEYSNGSDLNEATVTSSSSFASWAEYSNGSDINEAAVSKLIRKLQHGQPLEQEQAVVEVRRLTRMSAHNRLALCKPEFLEVLMPLAHSRYSNVQVNAVAAIMNVSLEKENKLILARSGAIPFLIDVLKSVVFEAQEHAAGAIFSLALHDENKFAIGVLGAIPPLIRLLRAGNRRARLDAAMALYHLSFPQINRSKLIKAGGLEILLGLCKGGKSDMVSRALLILCNVAAMQEGRLALMELSAVEVIVGLLTRVDDTEETGTAEDGEQESERNCAADVREHAAATLLQLSYHNSCFKSRALRAGVLDGLQRLAVEGTPRAREKATALLAILRESSNTDNSSDDNCSIYRRPYVRNARSDDAEDRPNSAKF